MTSPSGASAPGPAPTGTVSRGASVLVIGASGQVGHALCAEFAGDYAVTASSHQHAVSGPVRVDLADASSVCAAMREIKPAVVLLAGGVCNVDGCELDPDRCYGVNVGGTEVVADQARALGSLVVFFSTDHVFDGTRDSYGEQEPTSPINVYSTSKVRAEAVLARVLPERHLVVRTSSVYGPDVHRRNFVVRLVDRLSDRQAVPVPDDQWGSPTLTLDLARAVRVLVERGATGIYHATGPDFVSRVEFSVRICRQFGLDPSLVVPTPTARLRQPAPRPRGVRLDCSKLMAAGVEPFASVDDGLATLREEMAWVGAQ